MNQEVSKCRITLPVKRLITLRLKDVSEFQRENLSVKKDQIKRIVTSMLLRTILSYGAADLQMTVTTRLSLPNLLENLK